MMKNSAKYILKKMIKLLLLYIEELSEYKDNKETQFEYGEKTAYTECLEMLQGWSKAKKYGLDFDIEEKYPL